jgi:glycerate kinase
MRVLICPDKYKSSLSAPQVADAIAKGLLSANPGLEIDKAPMADGGDGTVDAFLGAMGGEKVYVRVPGPLGKPVDAFYGLIDGGRTAVIEMAAASGLALIPRQKRNPMHTTSFGTGALVRRALDQGVKKIIVGIGGSATNEGGMGMLSALGLAFFDADGTALGHTAADMLRAARIDAGGLDPRLRTVEIEVACDVNNPLCGPQGASAVFGPQKGATPQMIAALDEGLSRYAVLIRDALGVDILDVPGAGAAGGMGGALIALGAELRMGTDIVIEAAGLTERVKRADILFTGEGATDASTPFGKVPAAMGALAKAADIKCICIAGSALKGYRPIYDMGVTAVFSIMNRPMSMDAAINHAYALVMECAENVARAMGL